VIGIGRAFEQPRPLALLRLSWSGAQRPRDAVSRGLAAYDLRLHVTARIAFVRAQVGAIVLRQALEADEAHLHRALFAARARQSVERPGGMSGFGWLGHVVFAHDRLDRASPKIEFLHKIQILILIQARTIRGRELGTKMLFMWN